MSILGDNIRRLRKCRRLTQKELADKAGLSMTYINDIENDRKHPTPTHLNIAKALGVSVETLNKENLK